MINKLTHTLVVGTGIFALVSLTNQCGAKKTSCDEVSVHMHEVFVSQANNTTKPEEKEMIKGMADAFTALFKENCKQEELDAIPASEIKCFMDTNDIEKLDACGENLNNYIGKKSKGE